MPRENCGLSAVTLGGENLFEMNSLQHIMGASILFECLITRCIGERVISAPSNRSDCDAQTGGPGTNKDDESGIQENPMGSRG